MTKQLDSTIGVGSAGQRSSNNAERSVGVMMNPSPMSMPRDDPTSNTVSAPRANDVVVDAVSKVFTTKTRRFRALSEVSMSLPAGELTTIVGPSGCGKSTLLMIVAGLELPTGGQVRVGGRPITEPYPGLGIAFQRDLLLPGRTVLHNVMLRVELLGKKKQDYVDRARQLLASVGLADFVDFYPSALSGGMKQRVALCRAMVDDPTVLLLDEPFAAVDALAREELALQCAGLLTTESAPTILLVTHSIDEAVLMSDTVYVFSPNPGRVVGNVRVDLPKPRTSTTWQHPQFAEYATEIRRMLQHGSQK